VGTYVVEPYVVAADVYTAEGKLGRGGWTWYTGSASWLYRVGLETILGFTKRGDRLTVQPRVPRGVRVQFSVGEIADDLIRRLVAAEPRGRPVVVVTSDREIVADVHRAGAWTAPSAVLLALLG